ncbi:phosphotransferase [Phenylobacterium sp.]|jgi:aminoglycoside phosphotransferase (APT) family kinase protein|uniref:phosphotransferase n=1 Tax=Phenylobacterium sp. TaxID=1871053 RepID=UPI002F3FDD63
MAANVPSTLEQALDPAWLTEALTPVTGGARVTAVETVEVLRKTATKVRFTAAFEGARGGAEAFCLKAFLDADADTARAAPSSVREADFYARLAPKLSVRLPACVSTFVDREAALGVVIMRDLIAEGAYFCTALEAFDANQAADSLEQLARLHLSHTTPAEFAALPWVQRQLASLAVSEYVSAEMLQAMMDGPRGEGLPARTRDTALLRRGLQALSAQDAERPHVLIHGDCHAGNIFRTSEGAGLIDWQLLQRGSWALDVAYHIAAVLSVETAEREERALVGHYLDTVRRLGGATPDAEEAWTQYRMSAVYGFYLWAITRRVEPPIINVFVNRLGCSVTRHDSYRLLGL